MGSSQSAYQEMEKGTMERIPISKCTFTGSDELSDAVKKELSRSSLDDATPEEWSEASRKMRSDEYADRKLEEECDKLYVQYTKGRYEDQVDEAKRRKQRPVYSGVLKYFPNAIMEVAHCSYLGNEQHNPGTELHWDRSKSGDELDALVRHLMQADEKDTDGVLHIIKVCWRALAYAEKLLEKKR